MSDQTSAEIEREAERARARVADTANSIRNKLTAGQLIDQFSGMFSGGDLAKGLGNLKSQVRDNPLPLTLVGAGIALLAFGARSASHASSSRSYYSGSGSYGSGSTMRSSGSDDMASSYDDDYDAESDSYGSGSSSSSSNGGALRSAAGKAGAAVSNAVDETTDYLSRTADRLRETVVGGTSGAMNSAASKARGMASAATGVFDDEPLLLAAAGLVLGTAVGAMLPVSELEAEELGPHAAKLRASAEDLVDKGLQGASNVASKAYEALKDEADRQGLASSDGGTLGAKVSDVVKSTTDALEESLRSEFGTDDDRPRTG